MSAIQQTIPPLIGGVAQGADSQISASNLRVCDNFIPDLVWGLSKRPGSEFISPVSGSPDGSYFNVKLGDEDDYLIHVNRNGNVDVVDSASGELYSVTQQAASYLTHTGQGDIEVLKIGDFVFILNRTVSVGKAPITPPATDKVYAAWVELSSVSYNSSYNVSLTAGVNTYSASYTTPASGVIDVDTVLSGLRTALITALPTGLFAVEQPVGNVFSVRWVDFAAQVNNPFSLSANGGLAGNALTAYNGEVKSIEELPTQYYNARPVKVVASAATSGGYWVEFSPSQPGGWSGAGTWVETIPGGEQFRIDASTMPHALVRLGNGSWIVRPLDATSPVSPTVNTPGVVTSVSPTGTYNGRYWLGQTFYVTHATGKGLRLQVTAIDSNSHPTQVVPIRPGFGFAATNIVTANNGDQFEVDSVSTVTYNNPPFVNDRWTDRVVGSLETVPWPSFVGKHITGLGFYLNRLVVLSEDNVICSKAGDFLNFFPTTAVQVLADDPVDVNTGETTGTVLRHTVNYNGRLICVSADKQYALRGGDDGFTPFSANLAVSSRVKTSTIIPPLPTQLNWLVVEEHNSGVNLVEMYPNADDDPNLSRPTSLNIQAPSYVPRGVFSAAIEEDMGLVCLVSQQDRKSLYVWRWVDQARQRLLAAWFRIKLPIDVEHTYFLDNSLYCVGIFSGTRILIRMPLGLSDPSGRIEFEGFFFNPRLDLMDFTLNVTYSEATDQTTIPVTGTIYDTPSNLPKVFVLSGPNKFVFYEPTYNAGNLILPGNVGSTDAVLGYSFEAEALLPHIYLRGQNGQGVVSDPPKVRRVSIRSFRSGGFSASITVPGRAPYTAECSQVIARQYTLGELLMKRVGEITVPTMCDGDDMDFRILTSCPLPVHIQEITWKGTYSTKGLRSQ